MKPEEEKYLQKLYSNPARVGSLSGINSLSRAIKKENKYHFSDKQLKDWLRTNETYTLHKPLQRKFPRNPVIVGGSNIEWDLDLADMEILKKYNDGYSYFIVAIDDFSKYLHTHSLKTKTGKEVTEAMKTILEQVDQTPEIIRCDQGTEFSNINFKKLMRNEKIRLWITQNEKKANIAERCIKTIKNKIYRHFTMSQELRWIDILPKLTKSYNETYHRSIGMAPSDVNDENEDEIWQRLYPTRDLKEPEKFKFDINDKVRISVLRKAFEREYDMKWTIEFFIVADRFYKGDIAKYKLKDYDNEEIMGTFYEQELQKIDVKDDETFKIEKVIKKSNKRGRKEALVKWWGWPAKFNSWIPESELKDFK